MMRGRNKKVELCFGPIKFEKIMYFLMMVCNLWIGRYTFFLYSFSSFMFHFLLGIPPKKTQTSLFVKVLLSRLTALSSRFVAYSSLSLLFFLLLFYGGLCFHRLKCWCVLINLTNNLMFDHFQFINQ